MDRFVGARLDLVFSYPIWPVEIVQEHVHTAYTPERNLNGQDATLTQ